MVDDPENQNRDQDLSLSEDPFILKNRTNSGISPSPDQRLQRGRTSELPSQATGSF